MRRRVELLMFRDRNALHANDADEARTALHAMTERDYAATEDNRPHGQYWGGQWMEYGGDE